jgi:hypothetical protein
MPFLPVPLLFSTELRYAAGTSVTYLPSKHEFSNSVRVLGLIDLTASQMSARLL